MNTLPFLLGLAGVLSVGFAAAQARFWYDRLPDMPAQAGRPHPGVAGTFAGVSNGALLVVGGANFPNGYPWQDGTKTWHPTVYALTKQGTGYRWQTAGAMVTPRAYGASVVWNDQLIGIGGNDAQRRYAEVFTLRWDAASGRVQYRSLPALPRALANHSAALAGDDLYVFGGESDQSTEKSLYALNLKNLASGWQKRADFPGSARAFSALVAKANSLYVLGGRATTDGKTTVFRDAYAYHPERDGWSELPALPVPLAAHGAASGPNQSILIFGGDDGVRLGEIEALNRRLKELRDGAEKTGLTRQRNALQSSHPGFRREVWQFQTVTRGWSVVGTLPFATPVTTPVVRWGEALILPSGEISPGVRTPGSWRITFPKTD